MHRYVEMTAAAAILMVFEESSAHFTFMSPCIVIDFFLNNQPDALIIQIYSVIKPYMF